MTVKTAVIGFDVGVRPWFQMERAQAGNDDRKTALHHIDARLAHAGKLHDDRECIAVIVEVDGRFEVAPDGRGLVKGKRGHDSEAPHRRAREKAGGVPRRVGSIWLAGFDPAGSFMTAIRAKASAWM